jgi:hypothetical protein
MAPSPTRSEVMTPGSRLSNPMAMNRNDAPQISPIDVKIVQSCGVKAAWVVRPAGWGAGGAVVTPHLYRVTVRTPRGFYATGAKSECSTRLTAAAVRVGDRPCADRR